MVALYEEMRDTSRRKILQALASGPRTVSEIVAETELKQPNVSNHLGRLYKRNIVKYVRKGRAIRYELSSQEILAVIRAVVSAPEPVSDESVDFSHYVERLWTAAIAGDEDECGRILDLAFAHKAPLLDIYDRLLAPSMRMVGDAYCDQSIDEAQEHMASEIVLRLMARIVRIPGPPPLINKSCVVGCVPRDYHTIGPRMATDYLKLNGWRTLFCGGNVPIRSFLTTVLQNRPDLALISCGIEDGEGSAETLIQELGQFRNESRPLCIGIGGSFPDAARDRFRAAGADFVCRDLRHFALKIVPTIRASGTVPEELAWV